SDRVTVEEIVENPSIGPCGAAIHDVAACAANCLLRVVGTELPLERLAWLSEIDRVSDVGIRRDDVHRVADYQRLPFVTAKHAGGESPRCTEIRGIGGRDAIQSAVAGARVIAGRHLPFARWSGVWNGDAGSGNCGGCTRRSSGRIRWRLLL